MGILGRMLATGLDSRSDVRRPALHVVPKRERESMGRPEVTLADVPTGLILATVGVLYDDTLNWRWLSQRLMRMGFAIDFESLYGKWYQAWHPRCAESTEEFSAALRTFLGGLGLSAGQVDEVFAACHLRLANGSDGLCLLPGVGNTLSQLTAAGVPIAGLHRGPQPRRCVQEQLRYLRIEQYVQSLTMASDGLHAIDGAQPYLAVAEALALSPSSCLFVTARQEEAWVAATAGLRTAWIGHQQREVCILPGMLRLHRLDELLPMLLPRGHSKAA